jgi:ABC-type Fe3+/spermidine/putrescine transport system ATPase subunit
MLLVVKVAAQHQVLAQQVEQTQAVAVAVTLVLAIMVVLVDQVLSLLDTQFRKRNKTNGTLCFFRR